ncbi:class I SAM-dependent methyltransferase [uncultured Cyclobacterium sp.]|uniref:class I SAM-dependent methyltransferase n=1 Tax=uncultured Cyclobacterium sp. TaxID=453820 RepID=UPI0030EF0100|tara:strand:- start:74346 stop:75038 length:693 start_codon:yes stop_codon:yes gene_type:complete
MEIKKGVEFKDNYHLLAAVYDPLASLFLGEKFQNSKWEFLDCIQPGDTVWIIGGGTGANLPEILKRCGERGKIIFMEASIKMLEKAKGRIHSDLTSKVEFVCSDDFKLSKKEKIDVVITQFLLDVLADDSIDALFENVMQNVSPTTSWLFLDFYPVKNKKWLIHFMIKTFSILADHPRKELPDYDKFFESWDWEEIKTTSFENGFYRAKVYKLAPKPIKSDTISLKYSPL